MEKKPHLMAIVLFLTGAYLYWITFWTQAIKPTGRSMLLTRK